MLGRRHRNSVAEEGGRNMDRIWTEDGKRRQAGPLVGLHRLYTCPPGRSAVVSHPRDTCASCSELGQLRVGESSWLLLGKVDATSPSRTDRFTSALSIGCLSLCLAALTPSLILDFRLSHSAWATMRKPGRTARPTPPHREELRCVVRRPGGCCVLCGPLRSTPARYLR